MKITYLVWASLLSPLPAPCADITDEIMKHTTNGAVIHWNIDWETVSVHVGENPTGVRNASNKPIRVDNTLTYSLAEFNGEFIPVGVPGSNYDDPLIGSIYPGSFSCISYDGSPASVDVILDNLISKPYRSWEPWENVEYSAAWPWGSTRYTLKVYQLSPGHTLGDGRYRIDCIGRGKLRKSGISVNRDWNLYFSFKAAPYNTIFAVSPSFINHVSSTGEFTGQFTVHDDVRGGTVSIKSSAPLALYGVTGTDWSYRVRWDGDGEYEKLRTINYSGKITQPGVTAINVQLIRTYS
ncbi:TPA: hypothetical protein R4F10_003968 [Salmonella enterica subsp. enterica serovar Poona]|nr:hypothetical protein [Salmonella enterica subsp. enterica serovar Poona]